MGRKSKKHEEMSRLTPMERVDEIELQLPPKRDGQQHYQSQQYRQVEEMIWLCRSMDRRLQKALDEAKSYRRKYRRLRTQSTSCTTEQEGLQSPPARTLSNVVDCYFSKRKMSSTDSGKTG
jgi:hypothetical protein